MYSTLDVYGYLRTTTNQHFPCPSLGLPTYHVAPPQPSRTRLPSIHVTRLGTDSDEGASYTRAPASMSSKSLLPVMNPAFNLREICKQCILLEDHLSHDQKRCKDCCTKHFLALEALAEEAVTLDADGKFYSMLRDLPERIRTLEVKWMQDPERHSRSISQHLREIRKAFQEDCFDVIQFSCTDGACNVASSS